MSTNTIQKNTKASARMTRTSAHALSFLMLAGLFVLPVFAFAWSPGDPIVPDKCFSQDGGCGWLDLIELGQNIMHFSIYFMSICAVVAIAYAGFLYASSGGSDSQISKAHGIFAKVAWGIFFMLGAWLIVQTIIKLLGVNPDSSLLR